MHRHKRILSVILVLISAFIYLLVKPQSCKAEDKFGIGQFSIQPISFSPNQEETTAISGVVYHLNPEGNLSSPSISIEIKGQVSLPVTIILLSEEMLTKDSLATLGEWSFTATWNGTDARGQIVAPGEYVCEINLDLPNVGKDTKSATITVNTIE